MSLQGTGESTMYSLRILTSQPLRLALTIGGISLCIVLMLLLLGIYRGVADGSVDYIRGNTVDLWVLRRNATNILRGTSILRSVHGQIIAQVQGVRSASAVLLQLSTVKKEGTAATVFLTGFDPLTGVGGPPELVAGRSVHNDSEIVLDKSFAAKYQFEIGDKVEIQDVAFDVVGLSTGTNAFVIQYAFVSLRRAQALAGFPGIVTCFLITCESPDTRSAIAQAIRDELPDLEAYDHETFLQNNIREMESGFLPLLYTIAVIGAVVLTAILSLILSINILERRKDFATMKALGSSGAFLRRLIFELGTLICAASSLAALGVFFPLTMLVEQVTPEISTKSSPEQILYVILVVGLISICSSFISIHRLRRIYPLEAFA